LSDLQFVLDKLELLNAGADAQLAGALDTTRVALAGHSLGGLTTILEVAREPRFRAGIVLDGMMPNFAPPDIQTPMLILAAGRDTWSDAEQLLWASLHGERLAVNLRGAEHVTPSDLLWLAPGAVRTGTMGTEKTIAVIRSYTAAFLDANVLGKAPDVLLTQPPSEFPDVVLTTRDQMLRPKN
jgi:pimeloyl-ACP methyl ester carboxylesterase